MAEAKRTPHKVEAAIALRLAGATYDETAAALGFTSGRSAMHQVEDRLAEMVTPQDRGKLRQIATLRYERLLRSVWTKATDPTSPEHLSAIRTAREINDRLVALQGAAQPQEVIVRTPSTQELEQWVAEQMKIGLPEVTELDPTDVLEIEGEIGPTGA